MVLNIQYALTSHNEVVGKVKIAPNKQQKTIQNDKNMIK
jgi:hypothetical protein